MTIPASRLVQPRFWSAFTILWLAVVALPAVPGPVRPGLDPGWMTGLHLAFANDLVAGTDIVWTYGPFGWLTLPSATEEHLAAMLGYRLAMWAFWVCALAWLAFRTRRPTAVILFAVAAASATATTAFGFFLPDAQLSLAVLAAALLAISTGRPTHNIFLAILGALGGLASVIKFNVAAEAVAVFIGVAAIIIWDERRDGIMPLVRAGAAALVVPLSSFAFYTAATGHPEHYFAYLQNAIEISSGYSEGMSLPGPAFLVWFALGASAILLLVIPSISRRKASLLRGWFPATAVSFLGFKHGVVRGDLHMLPIMLNLSLAAAYLAVTAVTPRDQKRLAIFQVVTAALGLWMVLGVAPNGATSLVERLALKAAANTAGALINFPQAREDLAARNRANRTEMTLDSSLATQTTGKTVEVVPYETSFVWANDWNWRPRPVFQTYQVCTASHDKLNASHIAGPHAAEVLLFHWDPIDERHPLFVDPLSWRETLDNYDSISVEGRFLALGRRNHRRFGPPVELSVMSGAWDQVIPVPSSTTPLLLAADIPRSPLGQLSNLFYRVDPVWLELTGQDYIVSRWRFMRTHLPHGMLVNPFVKNIEDLAQLATPEFELSHRVITVRFLADNPNQFAPTFKVRWLSLPVAGATGSS